MTDTLGILRKFNTMDRSTVEAFVRAHLNDIGIDDSQIETILSDVMLTINTKMTAHDLVDSLILVCAQNIQNDPIYDDAAVRFLLTKGYDTALVDYDYEDLDQSYRESFVSYIKWGVEEKLLDKRLVENFDLYQLAVKLKPQRDTDFQYIGLQTLMNRYMIKMRESSSVRETPQFAWMRVAMGMTILEEKPTEWAISFYEKLSKKEYSAGGSTMIGAGTTMPTLANCFLLDTEDSIEHIFENVGNVAKISKGTGGIGLAITKLRAEGSPIKTNNTFSSGPIPFANIFDATLAAIARAGKKKGAMALYMENWHINFADFLDLRQNAGDDYRRTRTANTAVYISDEFMKRVQNGEDWYLFDPAEVTELSELYGSQFSKKYREYVNKAEAGQMRMWKKLPAREQYKQILTQLQSTSHPWITFKDTINLRALNNNTGTIHGSNLCTEVCLPQNRDNIAVCNLLYVNLTKHLLRDGVQFGGNVEANLQDGIDWELFEESIRIGIRHLDNIIEVGIAPVPEAKHSDKSNRAVGLGLMGLAEVYEVFGYPYDSEEAYELVDRIVEFIGYISIDESCNLAESRGSYDNFEGSMWSKGFVPFDTMNVLEQDRGVDLLQNTEFTMDWDRLRARVKKGVRNATVMMIAPNGNSSLVAGTSPGIDPRFALIFSRTTMNGKFLDINRNLVTKLKELGIWEDVREKLISHQGDISRIEEIPEEIKEVFKTSFQISPYAYIEVASRCQKWIDQSMSRNMYLSDRSIDHMIDVYMEAWKRGLKTTYYLHMMPRHTAEQSTVKVNKSTALNMSGFGSLRENKSHVPSEESTDKVINLPPSKSADAVVDNQTDGTKTVSRSIVKSRVEISVTKDKDSRVVSQEAPREKINLGVKQPNNDIKEAVIQQKGSGSGFGFGSVGAKNSSKESSKSYESANQKNDAPVGFGKVRAAKDDSAELENPTSVSEPTVIYSPIKACPVDPIERAACDSCE